VDIQKTEIFVYVPGNGALITVFPSWLPHFSLYFSTKEFM